MFELDPNKLDREWILQPQFYHEAALKLVEAREQLERAKAAKDVVIAEWDKEIRSNPQAFGLEKITEGVVANTLLLQPEVKKAIKRVIEAKHEADVHQVAVDTLDHRKKALENLVQLRLADYYSEPRTPKGVPRRDAEASIARDNGKRRRQIA